jgi:hypothetical protein
MKNCIYIYVKNFTDYITADSDNILWRRDPLLGKYLERNNETTAVAMQLRGKYVTTTTNTHSTIELLLESVFYPVRAKWS